MGLFDKFFGKKQTGNNTPNGSATETVQSQKGDTFVSTGQGGAFKVTRPLTKEQREAVHNSTILLRTGQLYMHYWTDHLICTDRKDPESQNKVMFFWKAEEPFPKKSLPPVFETFQIKHFLFSGDTSKISMQVAEAMPWFGMPGLGVKHACKLNGEDVTIPELNKPGLVEYIELVELTNDKLDILTNKESYLFLIDDSITPFQNGNFLLQGKPIPIDVAYEVGGIHIIKKSQLQST
jgi:hypothetical protein